MLDAWAIATPFFFLTHGFVGQKFENGSAEKFLLGVSHADVDRCWPGLPSSEDWTSKTAHSCGWS